MCPWPIKGTLEDSAFSRLCTRAGAVQDSEAVRFA